MARAIQRISRAGSEILCKIDVASAKFTKSLPSRTLRAAARAGT
jgi:hypothetical protein